MFTALDFQNILHPLTELSDEWVNFTDGPDIDQKAQPIWLGESIYTKGMVDGKQTAWKYCIPTKSWSPMPSPPGVDADDYVLAIYRSQLVWIGGRVHNENHESNKKVFVYEQDKGWKENTSVPPLPVGLLNRWCLFASGDDNFLVVAYDSMLLVFDSQQWQQKASPKRDVCVLLHCGELYLISQGHIYKASMQSLLAENDHDWVMSKLPCAYETHTSSLTLAGDYVMVVVLINNGFSHTLYILSLSSTSDSWIVVTQLTHYCCGVPSIVGCPTGKLLLLGLMDPQNLPSLFNSRIKMIELAPNGM